jgi:endonuclease-8
MTWVPEGDTIFRTAWTLNQALAGRTVRRFETMLPRLARERMNGSWHIYRPNERWQRRRSEMRIVIGTNDWIAVGFNIPVAELHDDHGLERQNDLRRIGPDLLDPNFDADEALRRIRAREDGEIANVLLNQWRASIHSRRWQRSTTRSFQKSSTPHASCFAPAQCQC